MHLFTKFPGILLIFGVVFIPEIQAQSTDTIQVQLTTPVSIKGCHQNIFQASMIVDSTTTLNIQIDVRDSTGIADTSCNGITPIIISLENPNPFISGIIYYPLTSTWSCTLAPGTINFNLLVAIDCSAIPINDDGEPTLSSVHLFQQWTSNSNDYFEIDSTNVNSANSTNIISPWLVDISPDNYPTSYGIASELFFEYKNTGIGANVKFVFEPGSGCTGYMEDSLRFGIRDTSGNVASYSSYAYPDSQSVYLPYNNSIVIKRSITVIDCLEGCNNQSAIFKWRCDSLPGADSLFCEDCQETFQSIYTVNDTLPGKLFLERIAPSYDTAMYDFSCPGDPLSWTFRIKNTGIGTVAESHVIVGGNNIPSGMTDVSASSLTIDISGCVDCTFDSTIVLKEFASNCGMADPVFYTDIFIRELAGGDSVDISFNTTRCCAENDSLLLNQDKFFNHCTVKVTGKDSCGTSVSESATDTTFNPQLGGTNLISSQPVNNYADVKQNLAFIPLISDLSVKKDSIFGEMAPMHITFESTFLQTVDYQIVGCNSDPDCLMNGYLRAKVYTDYGLHISDYSSVYFQSDTIDDWYPEFYYTSKTDTAQCLEGYYYFYFNLADSSAKEMLEAGNFMFTLQACCPQIVPELPFTNYSVAFHLLMNPNNCYTISAPDSIYDAPDCPGCCWLPLSSEGDKIAVHCPGCVIPGIIVDQYKLERQNYGLEDDDNNRRADISLTPIIIDSTYYNAHQPFIRSTFSMHGDQVQDVTVAHFEPGTNYSYAKMIDSVSADLNYIHLRRVLEHADTIGLVVKDMDFYIDVPDTNGGCKDCAAQNVRDTLFRTIQQNHVFADSLFEYLEIISDSGDNTYFFTFGIDSIDNLFRHIVYQDSVTPFATFAESQQYRLVVRYNVCGNWQSSDEDNSWKQSDISNFMWLTGSHKPWDTPDLPAPDSVVFPVDQSFADMYLFYCEKFGGKHFFVSNEYLNLSGTGNSGCDNGVGVSAVTTIGGPNTGDVFPYEFRIPAYKPINYEILLPFGMSLGIGTMYSKDNTNSVVSDSGHFSVTPDGSNHYLFSESDYQSPKCFTDTSTLLMDSLFYTFDQYSNLGFDFNLQMDTCDPGFFMTSANLIFIDFTDNHDGCILNIDSTCMADTMDVGPSFISTLTQPNPNLNLNISLLTVPAEQNEICWNFTITNPDDTTLIFPFETTSAYNLYLIPPDTLLFPNLQGWNCTVAGNPTPVFPDSTGVIHLADYLTVDASGLTGSICANFVYCSEQLFDTVSFTWGWNCDDYPIPGDSVESCNETIDSLQIQNFSGAIIPNIEKFQSADVLLCDTMYFGVLLSAANAGFVYPDSLFLTDLPVGLTIVNAYIGRYNGTSTLDSLLLPGTGPGWAVTDSMMDAIGFSQFGFNSLWSLKANYYAIVDCQYNDSLPTHNLASHNYCFDSVTTVIPHNGSVPISGSNCNNCFTVNKTASQDTVIALSDTVTYTITVCANNAGPEAISLTEYLPLDFNVINSNFPATDTIPGDTCFVYTVTGTFTVGGNCTQSCNSVLVSTPNITVGDSVCITVLPSCFSWSYTLIPDSALSSSYSSAISNDTLFISGVFFIDSTLTLTNCVVYANACAQIIVLAPAALILDSTLIEGCDQMWQGIYLNSYSRIGVQKHSTIRDANIAIFVNDRTELKIINSALEDFIIGIYVPPNNSGFNSIIFQAVYGNKFGLFGSALKTPYLGQAAFGTIPRSGIEVNDVVWHLNYAAADSNYFYNMNKGVIGYRSKLTVENNKFSTIIPDAFYTDPWDGSAISSLGDQGTGWAGSLTVIPVTSGAPTIESCEVGVHTDYSYLDISNVHMRDMGTGVFTNNCIYLLHSDVVNNVIEAHDFGINWMMNIGAKKMNADNNNIYMTGASSMGISMKEGTVAASANYSVTNNYINNDGGDAGILGQSLLQAIIRHNIVDIGNNSTSQMSGIAINGNESSQISCNSIKGDGVSATDTLQHGIHVSISNYCDVSCNNTDSTGWGIFFGGICAQTSFKGNIMDDHFEGLRLNNVAVIDTQNHAGNRWIGSYGSFGSVNFNAALLSNLLESLFEVNATSIATLLPSTPISIPNNTGWFDPLLSGTAFSCADSSVCDDSRHRESSEDLRTMIAIDSTLTSDFIPESNSIAKGYLYQALKKDSASITNNILSDFVTDQSVLPIGYLYETEKALKESYNLDSSISTNLNYYRNQIGLFTDSLYYYDSLQVVNPLTIYSIQRESIIYQINNLTSSITNLLNQQQSYITSKLIIASQQNNLVQPNEVPEANQKFINTIEIFFRNGGKDAIQSYLPQIQEISEQCPYKGGAAVYKARTFVELFLVNVSYNDQNLCALEGIYRNSIQTYNHDPKKIIIIPNPANEFVEIFLSGSASGYYDLTIHDTLGKLVYKKVINSNILRINTSKFSPSVYSIDAKVDEIILHEKLVIVR